MNDIRKNLETISSIEEGFWDSLLGRGAKAVIKREEPSLKPTPTKPKIERQPGESVADAIKRAQDEAQAAGKQTVPPSAPSSSTEPFIASADEPASGIAAAIDSARAASGAGSTQLTKQQQIQQAIASGDWELATKISKPAWRPITQAGKHIKKEWPTYTAIGGTGAAGYQAYQHPDALIDLIIGPEKKSPQNESLKESPPQYTNPRDWDEEIVKGKKVKTFRGGPDELPSGAKGQLSIDHWENLIRKPHYASIGAKLPDEPPSALRRLAGAALRGAAKHPIATLGVIGAGGAGALGAAEYVATKTDRTGPASRMWQHSQELLKRKSGSTGTADSGSIPATPGTADSGSIPATPGQTDQSSQQTRPPETFEPLTRARERMRQELDKETTKEDINENKIINAYVKEYKKYLKDL